MPTNFPASNDVFNVPSTPASTPLGETGDGSRTHAQHHTDMGDALEAMQPEQVLLAHSHNGTTFRHGSKLAQGNTHQSADTDTGTSSLHHTIGVGANQYASGTHTHPAVVTYPVGAFFFSSSSSNPSTQGVVGTWVAVGQRFLCAQGGTLGLTAGSIGGSNSHTHNIDDTTNTLTSHTHSIGDASTGLDGGHSHTGGDVNSNGVSHTHPLNTQTLGAFVVNTGGNTWTDSSHSHTSASDSATHAHTSSSVTAIGDHGHELPSTTTGTGGGHSHTNDTTLGTTNNLVPLFVVYMWKRTA